MSAFPSDLPFVVKRDYIVHFVGIGWPNQGGWNGWGITTCKEDEKYTENFNQENIIRMDYLGYIGIGMGIILKWILKISCKRVEWIQVTQDRWSSGEILWKR